MSKLEQTLVAQARRAMEEMRAEIESPTDVHTFTAAHAALYAFLEFSHFDSGLSKEAQTALRELEKSAARYLADRQRPETPPPAPAAVVDISRFRKK